ncbi:hypothetical protein SAMN05421748_108175 [Paractinoplanes atraurantiacus]|uniref:Uncharacterized protein n=1 Tax=Paractinoplanes atraurantiacus TaxID=1036182 RepID=A0A285II20_9ACTN|nr:hypothetical protein SAMN05421748_108175 [Actinoplanes atraurantiacus]
MVTAKPGTPGSGTRLATASSPTRNHNNTMTEPVRFKLLTLFFAL